MEEEGWIELGAADDLLSMLVGRVIRAYADLEWELQRQVGLLQGINDRQRLRKLHREGRQGEYIPDWGEEPDRGFEPVVDYWQELALAMRGELTDQIAKLREKMVAVKLERDAFAHGRVHLNARSGDVEIRYGKWDAADTRDRQKRVCKALKDKRGLPLGNPSYRVWKTERIRGLADRLVQCRRALQSLSHEIRTDEEPRPIPKPTKRRPTPPAS